MANPKWKPTKMCATDAKAKFRLDDDDLARIAVEYKTNPYRARGPSMRLYLIGDVEELSRIVGGEREVARREAEAAQAVEDERLRLERTQAAAAMAAWTEPRVEVHGSAACPLTSLPTDILELVTTKLAARLEPGGVIGPTAIARDLCNVAGTCRDLRAAAYSGFRELARLVPTLPEGTDWRTVFADPMSLKAVDLRDAARSLGLRVGGIKSDLAVRIAAHHGLKARAPACEFPDAVASVTAEKRLAARRARGPMMDALACVYQSMTAKYEIPSLYEASRAYLHVPGWTLAVLRDRVRETCPDMASLLEVVRKLHTDPLPTVREQRAIECGCGPGRLVARECTKGMCGACCRSAPGACHRHAR
jgi:hypothetical protein